MLPWSLTILDGPTPSLYEGEPIDPPMRVRLIDTLGQPAAGKRVRAWVEGGGDFTLLWGSWSTAGCEVPPAPDICQSALTDSEGVATFVELLPFSTADGERVRLAFTAIGQTAYAATDSVTIFDP